MKLPNALTHQVISRGLVIAFLGVLHSYQYQMRMGMKIRKPHDAGPAIELTPIDLGSFCKWL